MQLMERKEAEETLPEGRAREERDSVGVKAADDRSVRKTATERHRGSDAVEGRQSLPCRQLKPWHGYLFATMPTLTTLGLRLALNGQLRDRPTLIIFTVPIMLSAYLGGLRAGLLATAISYFGVCYYLLPPFHSFRVAYAVDRWDLFFLALAGIAISVLNEALQRARRRADIATRDLLERVALVKVEILQTAIFNNANFSSIATDAKGVIQIFNVGAERMLGYAAAEVVNKLTPADFSDPQEMIARANALSVEFGTPISPGLETLGYKASRGIEYVYEPTLIRKDGSRFPAVVSVTALRDARGAVIGYLLIGTDNTARKQVDDALRKKETQLQTIIENISEAVVVSDLNGELLHFNRSALEMLGYASLEEGRRNYSQLADTFELSGVDGVDWTVDQWPMARILRGEKLYGLEARMRRFGAEWEHIYSFGGTIARDASGKPIMAVVTFSDITQRRRAESAALRLAAIVESSVDAVIGKDLNGIVTSWNAAAEMMFGYSAAEMVGQSITLIIPANHKNDEEQILSRIKRGERVEHFETERLRKDGRLISISATISPIKDSHGRIIGASKVARDITERKQAAEALRVSEARLKMVTDNARVGLVMVDQGRRYTFANATYAEILGLPSPDIIGQRVADVLSTLYEEQIRPRLDRAFAGERLTYELRRPTPDGVRYYSVRYEPPKVDGAVSVVVVVITDITERKQAEEGLRASELQLQAILENLDQGVVVADLGGQMLHFNRAALDMHGYANPEDWHRNLSEFVDTFEVSGKDGAVWAADQWPMARVLRGEALHNVEMHIRRIKTGWKRILNVGGVFVHDADGKPLLGTVTLSDITERKQAEEALLKAGALQRAIFNSANFSSIATDAKGVIQIFNVGAERMLGYTAAEVMNKITPAEISDPAEVITRAQALSLELGTPITPGFEALVFKASRGIEDIYELTYFRKDGSRFPAVVSVTALRDAQDAIIGYLLIGTDNTARKQAEEALLKAGALQSAIFNSANFSSIATDAKGVIQIFNVGAERMLGYSAAEVMNKITPADISDPEEVIARAQALSLESGVPITPGFEALVFKASRGIEDIYELTYVRKDGSRFPAVVSVTALRDAHETIIGYLLIGTDNTQRQRAELAAVLLAAVVESSSDAVIGMDLNSVVTRWNNAAERIFGYSADEIVGRPVALIIPPDRLGDEGQIQSKIRRGELIEHFETERLRKDGGLIAVSVTVTPIKDSRGQVVGASKVVRDITERQRAAAEIRQLNTDLEQRVVERTAQLQTANNELEAFSYSVSHDLRAPLRSLDGFSQALLEDYADNLDPEGQDNLQRIRKASQRMGQLIDDLLNLSRLTRAEMKCESVDLSKMALEIADELRSGDPGREASFAIGEGLVAQADPRLLRIALTNLLSNAWKFTAKRTDARIEFGCVGENGTKEFFVRDNGVGFDMAYAGKLFGAFQRLHAMNDFPGTGIGLATVQRIIHRHGGRIWADSAVDAGATFHFTL